MPHSLFWENQGAVVRYAGHVTLDEVMSAISRYEADERFDSMRYVLIDTLAVESISIDMDAIEDIWAQDLGAWHSNPALVKAFVTKLPQLVEIAQAYRNAPIPSYQLEIFDSESTARAWIAENLPG